MIVRMKLYGVFKSAAGRDTMSLDIPEREPTVRSAINKLLSQPDFGELKKLVLEEQTADPRSNALILVGGREIGALAGLDTKLKTDQELSLLPVAHGG